jgi:hypothetical protein
MAGKSRLFFTGNFTANLDEIQTFFFAHSTTCVCKCLVSRCLGTPNSLNPCSESGGTRQQSFRFLGLPRHGDVAFAQAVEPCRVVAEHFASRLIGRIVSRYRFAWAGVELAAFVGVGAVNGWFNVALSFFLAE